MHKRKLVHFPLVHFTQGRKSFKKCLKFVFSLYFTFLLVHKRTDYFLLLENSDEPDIFFTQKTVMSNVVLFALNLMHYIFAKNSFPIFCLSFSL